MSQNQSSYSSQHSNQSKKKSKRRRIPIMDPLAKMKIKTSRIIINLSLTHYDVIVDVAQSLDWSIQYSGKKGDWDVLWTDDMVQPETLLKMQFFQKISHFPGIYVIARKNLLGLSLVQMAKKFPSQYNFFPKTWLLPTDFSDFRLEVQSNQLSHKPKCFIVKPQAQCQGRGIFLTFKTDDVQNGKHYVIQQYLSRPFLIDGLKFDFRVYVLLCGTNPMRLYVYQQGLARLATQKYQIPNKNNIKKMCMHLTNYAINKKNPKYIFNNSVHSMNIGHKRALTSVYKNIQRGGGSVIQFKKKLDNVIIKTLILGQPLISHQYKFSQPDDQYRNMCFHILGIDIMINQKFQPYILQVNHTPSFATDTPLDYFIKFNLIKDTLILMNICQQSKKKFVQKTRTYQRQRIITGKKLIENQQQKQKIKSAQSQRDLFQNCHLGRYRKIYPNQNQQQMNKYQELLKHSEKIFFHDNNVLRVQIQLEKDKDKNQKKDKDKDKDKEKDNDNDKTKGQNNKDQDINYTEIQNKDGKDKDDLQSIEKKQIKKDKDKQKNKDKQKDKDKSQQKDKDKSHQKNKSQQKQKQKQKLRYKDNQVQRQRQQIINSIRSIKTFQKFIQPIITSPIRSNNSSVHRKNQCNSEKLIQQIQEKYPSSEFFLKQGNNFQVQSIFRGNFNHFCANFSYTNRLKNAGKLGIVKANTNFNYHDIQDEKQLISRLKFIKNLPKIQKPHKKSSTIQVKKSKYIKDNSQKIKQQNIKQSVKQKGSFLKPKNAKFSQVQQELLYLYQNNF